MANLKVALLFGTSLLCAAASGQAQAATTDVPFWAALVCSTTNGGECTKSIRVPAALHWTIQTVTGFCTQTTEGDNPIYEIFLATTVGKTKGGVFFIPGPASQVNGGIAKTISATGSPLAYADPGTTVTFTAIESFGGPLGCTVYISGRATAS